MEPVARKLYPSPKITLEPKVIRAHATEAYQNLRAKYQATGKADDFDFRRHCVQWTARGDHLTHRLHRYPGRLTPYIPLFFLGVEGVAVRNGSLLDPFAGCGTVLVEAAVHPVHPMKPVGFEINPLARMIAKVKTTSLDSRAIYAAWERIVARYHDDKSRAGLPQFPNKRHWFTERVERRLARVLRALRGLRDPNLRDFFLVAASSVVRQVSLADPSVSVPVRLDPSKYKKASVRAGIAKDVAAREDADVLALLRLTVSGNLSRVQAWSKASCVESGITIVGADARSFVTSPYTERGELGAASHVLSGIDLVLTSPPYANAQRYTRSLRLEQFVLGYARNGAEERALDRLQVGTERVAENEWEEMLSPTNVPTADRLIATVSKEDRYRAAIVGRYTRDMRIVITNCFNALKPDGHAVFVIGNNSIRGRLLNNAEMLSEIAEAAGFVTELCLRNRIPSRGLLTKRHHTAGVITHEHVLVFRKPSC